MHVYRVITKEELLNSLGNKNIEVYGSRGKNTFCYDKDISYKHFFKYLESAKMFFDGSLDDGCYIKYELFCLYDIPVELLDKYKGFGLYKGVVNDYKELPVPEFAIPDEYIIPDYLVDIGRNFSYSSWGDITHKEYFDYINYLKELCVINNNVDEIIDTLLNNMSMKEKSKIKKIV